MNMMKSIQQLEKKRDVKLHQKSDQEIYQPYAEQNFERK